MGRLSKHLDRANEAIAGVEDAVMLDVEKVITRTKEVHKTRETVFLQKHMSLDGQMSDLKEFATDLENDLKNDKRGASGGAATGTPYTGTGGTNG